MPSPSISTLQQYGSADSTDVWTMGRGELFTEDVDQGGCGVGNGLVRERVDFVVDNVDKIPTHDVPTPDTNKDKKSSKPATKTLQQHLQTKRQKKSHTVLGVAVESGPDITTMPDAQNNTINNKYCCCCMKHHTY